MGDSQAISNTWPVSNHPQMPEQPLRATTKCPMWQKTLIFTRENIVCFFLSLTFLKTLSSPVSGLRNPSVSLPESRNVTVSELQV